MIGRVASALASHPGVIGYDLLNEPRGDEVMDLGPLYNEAAAVIRSASPDAIIFVSPQAITAVGGPTHLPRPSFDNFAYSPHYYDVSVTALHDFSGGTLATPFQTMCGQASSWGVPLVLGEFGATPSTGHIGDYLDAVYAGLDGCLASGQQWVFTPGWTPAAKDGWNAEDFSIVDDQGVVRASFRARPYPRRVTGRPTRFSAPSGALPVKGAVELDWDNDPAASGPTEIFVPAAMFGVTSLALARQGAGLGCTQMGDLVTCQSASAGAMSVKISAPAEDSGCSAAPGGAGTGSLAWVLVGMLWHAGRSARRHGRRRGGRGGRSGSAQARA